MKSHQFFIDWMKAVGMFLIVFGHVVGDPFALFNSATQPVYAKQLGVAFFVFATGWSLANEHRPRCYAVFTRIFPLYFWGVLFAFISSVVAFVNFGDVQESNYLPFLAGINVLMNYFPANPTTWYIGLYLHLLACWFFVFQGKPVTGIHVVLVLVLEWLIRAAILYAGLEYTAYMTLPNWLTVFVLGMYCHSARDKAPRLWVLLPLIGWLTLLSCWSRLSFNFGSDFPFREVSGVDPSANTSLYRSALISLVYCVNTLAFFYIARLLPQLDFIKFLARNTIIIFIAHMPLIFALAPLLYSLIDPVWLEKGLMIFGMYLVLALLSEGVSKFLPIKRIRDACWIFLVRLLPCLQK